MARISLRAQKAMQRWIAIQRHGTHVTNETRREYEAILRELFLYIDRPRLLKRKIKELMPEARKSAVKKLVDQVHDAASAVSAAEHARLLETDKDAKLKKMNKAEVVSVFRDEMTSISDSPSNGMSKAFARSQRSMTAVADEALLKGYSKTKTAFLLKSAQDQLARDVESSAKSFVNKATNYAYEKQYVGTNVDRVMWISTLDHRTSPFCQAADGKVFKINKGPRPPAHYRCRSTVIVIAEGESATQVARELSPRPAVVPKSDELLKEKGLRTRTGRVRYPSKTDRSPLKGTAVRNTNYETWLRSQSAEYQNQIIGKKSAKRFRKGTSLTKVLDDKNSSIDFSSLEKALN